jgi:hypothetical protein
MKKIFSIFLIVMIIIYSPTYVHAQQTLKSQRSLQEMHDEKVDDPYLPNAHNNKKVSPAYKYSSSAGKKIKAGASTAGSSIFTIQVNVDPNNQNILDDAANEPNIVYNEATPNVIVIGWRQFDNVGSNFRQAGYSYSHDGGQSWTFPGVIEPGIFRSDPVLDFDNAGNLYYNSLTSAGTNLFPCTVFKSTNGGASWDLGTAAGGGDKQWMAIDRTNGVGDGNIYSAWTAYYSFCPPGNFTRTSNISGGFEPCTLVDGDPALGTETIGNSGEVYIAGRSASFDSIVVCKSTDAQNPGSSATWNPVNMYLDGYISTGATVNPLGLTGQVNIDVDRSSGAGRGNVYVLATLQRISVADQGDVMFAKSTDGGSTWQAPIKINDDTNLRNTQWMGTMSVAPNGRIDVVWLDTRDDSTITDLSSLYYSYSTDQGSTWSSNEKLSEIFDPHFGYPDQNKMGDYFDMISDNNGAHLAWANTLNGEEDVYYSNIVPGINTGIENYLALKEISIFPNPAFQSFSIKGIKSEVKIELLDILGGKLLEMNSDNFSTEVNISELAKGIYIVKITGENGNSVLKKIVKE